MNGDIDGSLKLQLSMLNVINSLFCEVNPIPIKAALNLMGYNVGNCRRPLTTMEPENLDTLKNALKEYGILV
jgi:4-hydroxy-tetrahydrodipicolinate synthase